MTKIGECVARKTKWNGRSKRKEKERNRRKMERDSNVRETSDTASLAKGCPENTSETSFERETEKGKRNEDYYVVKILFSAHLLR